MYFFIKDAELLEKYNGILSKVSNSIKKGLDCKPIYNKKIVETKIRSYRHDATDFHNKVDCNYTCLTDILIDFILKKDKTIN